MNSEILIIALLIAPLIAAVGGFVLGKQYPYVAKFIALLSSIVLLALSVFLAQNTSKEISWSALWIYLGKLHIDFSLQYGPLSAMMVLVVAIVGFAVTLFSLKYMSEDAAQPRYYSAVSLFIFAMLGLALSNNLLMLFAFWEMVGFGSYILIGHYDTFSAGLAANKAFLVNRLGDVFFILGIVFVLCQTGSSDMSLLSAKLNNLPMTKVIGMLIFAGVMAKSAQFPAHIWLPDAMAGPTPISALIHAATMVAAGVYLLCRLSFIFIPILPFIAWVGALSAILSALWAFGQSDIKRVLAYSTLSQLGFMVAGFGLGSPGAAFFHLTTHAFFKALLFLAAGAVLSACHHEQDAWKMGGLWKKMPFTFAVFVIGALALAGFPFTAGFFSKDTILLFALSHNMPIFIILMISSLLTALYMGRIIGLAFLGEPRSQEASLAHEGSMTYQIPLTLLAIGAILGGYKVFYPSYAASILSKVPAVPENHLMLLWSLCIILLAIFIAFIYSKCHSEPLEGALKGFYRDLREGFYVDHLWQQSGRFFDAAGAFFAKGNSLLTDKFFGAGIGKGVAFAGQFAKSTYKRILTAPLYWIFIGAILFISLFIFHHQ